MDARRVYVRMWWSSPVQLVFREIIDVRHIMNATTTIPPRLVTVAATQLSCSPDSTRNINAAENLVRRAAQAGANVILLQELFATQYFCQEQSEKYYTWAENEDSSALLKRFQHLAAELGVVLPISFFERANNAFFNSVVIFDADGSRLGLYRKSHIPDGPGYQEKFYFNPGDTGFKVFSSKFGKIGVAICWDQWFPEAARAMALQGAEVIFYPTAIGTEPQDPTINSSAHWRRVMQGHAGANMVPVVASNRVGREEFPSGSHIMFYGSSFIADQTGAIVAECSYDGPDPGPAPGGSRNARASDGKSAMEGDETVLKLEGIGEDSDRCEEKRGGEIAVHTFDLEGIRLQRAGWGLFRDRRPDLYQPLLSLDGSVLPK